MTLEDLNENQIQTEGAEDRTTGQKRYDDRVVTEFDHMNLKKDLLHGIYSYGFEKPSQIQKKCILPITTSNPPADVIGQAQSGTGKTATFTIGMLQRIDEKLDTTQAIILAPTRELAIQIHDVVIKLGKHLNIKAHVCVGGTKVEDDREILREGVHVVVGTPGRVIHMMDEEFIKTENLKMLIIDEADEMLEKDFKDQLYDIFKSLPEALQICLFSATLTKSTFDITKKFMRDPIQILVKKEQLTLEGIKQFYVDVGEDKFKLDVILDLYQMAAITQCVVFLNSRKRVDWLAARMENEGHTVQKMHSGIDQSQRTQILHEFLSGSARLLITTDLTARGIDGHHVSLVINFDMPKQRENYLHRIGRAGRYGRKGVSINLITEHDREYQKMLVKHYATVIDPMPQNIETYISGSDNKNE